MTAMSVTIRGNAPFAGDGEGAFLDYLGVVVAVGVLHGDDDCLGSGGEVHGAPDVADTALGEHPIGKVPGGGYLVGSQGR